MKTGIIGAMETEIRSLRDSMEINSKVDLAGMEFYEGKLDGADVVLVKCGIGKVNAGICAQILISEFHVDRVINTGVAGSLDNRIDIGDIVVATEAVQHDYDVSPIGFRKGEIPFTGVLAFPADETMRIEAKAAFAELKEEHPAKIFEGRVCSGDQFISSREQKEKIIKEFGGLCCEMEGGAIAQICFLNKTPFVVIRAISDKADESGDVSFEQFEKEAARRCAMVVHKMVGGSR